MTASASAVSDWIHIVICMITSGPAVVHQVQKSHIQNSELKSLLCIRSFLQLCFCLALQLSTCIHFQNGNVIYDHSIMLAVRHSIAWSTWRLQQLPNEWIVCLVWLWVVHCLYIFSFIAMMHFCSYVIGACNDFVNDILDYDNSMYSITSLPSVVGEQSKSSHTPSKKPTPATQPPVRNSALAGNADVTTKLYA